MMDTKKIAIKGSTQDHLPIEDVREGIVVMKDGAAAMVIRVSSVNFDLLSEREQSALVHAYGGILNSLTFPVQILIRSAIKDVSSYVSFLSVQEKRLDNELLRDKIRSYRNFIGNVVKQNKVLAKSFYVVVPFSVLELGVTQGMGSSLPKAPWGRKKTEKGALPFKIEYILEKAKASLDPKREHVERLFGRLGLQAKALNTQELIQLFYEIYNEDSAATQMIQTSNYTAAMVTTTEQGEKNKVQEEEK